MGLLEESSSFKESTVTVSIYAADRQDLSLDLNHQNFCWLMQGLGLSYTYDSQSMLPSEVKEAIKRFWAEYCGLHSSDRKCSYRKLKVERWIGLLQAKRSPPLIMGNVVDSLGGNVVDISPDWSDLGDPFTPCTEAYRLREQFMGYVRALSLMAKHCIRTSQIIVVS